MKGLGRESWMITGSLSDLIKCQRNLFIAHASHTVPEKSMAGAGSVKWRSVKDSVVPFQTNVNITTLVNKSAEQVLGREA